MALASRPALISHHLLRDQREGDLGDMPGMWTRRPPRQDRASQCDLIVVGAILLSTSTSSRWLGFTPPLRVNDGLVTRDGAYFTDSLKPFLYRGPIAPSGTLGMISQAISHGGCLPEVRSRQPGVLRTAHSQLEIVIARVGSMG
jgi:hypothetical protein